MLRKVNGEQGFSLIELMIVIVVIGILAGVAIPQISQVRQRARVSNVKSEFASLKPVMEMYYMDNGQYPDDLSKLTPNYTTDAVLQDGSGAYYDNGNVGNPGEGDLNDIGSSGTWQAYELEYNQEGTVVRLDSTTGEVTH